MYYRNFVHRPLSLRLKPSASLRHAPAISTRMCYQLIPNSARNGKHINCGSVVLQQDRPSQQPTAAASTSWTEPGFMASPSIVEIVDYPIPKQYTMPFTLVCLMCDRNEQMHTSLIRLTQGSFRQNSRTVRSHSSAII